MIQGGFEGLTAGSLKWLGNKMMAKQTIPKVEPKTLKPNIQLFAEKESTTRVWRWMSKEEYKKMLETGRVQMSLNGTTTYVANPADINAFGKQNQAVFM